MGKINMIIKDLESLHKGSNRPWIYDENGKMKDNIICGDVIPLLEELKEYEVGWPNSRIERFVDENEGNNTSNWGANINHDICYYWKEGSPVIVMMIHRTGDIRGNYTDWFVVESDDSFEHPLEWLYEFDSSSQHKCFGGHYVADIDLFREGYSVYDSEKRETIGDYYELGVEDLLEEIHNTI